MPWLNRKDDTRSNAPQSTSPAIGLKTFSALIFSASALQFFLLRRRLARTDATLAEVRRIAKKAAAQHAQTAKGLREMQRIGEQVEVIRGLVEKVGGDVRDVRSLMMKDRARFVVFEERFDALSDQLKTHEQRVLDRLAAEHKRSSRTDNEISELRKQADQNANKLNKVGVSIADIAGYIDRKEIEDGVLPEEGKESSKRVNSLRDSALDMLQNVKGSNYGGKGEVNININSKEA